MYKMLALLSALIVGLTSGMSEAAYTVDLSGVTTDIGTIGAAVLAVLALILGFRLVKRMVA